MKSRKKRSRKYFFFLVRRRRIISREMYPSIHLSMDSRNEIPSRLISEKTGRMRIVDAKMVRDIEKKLYRGLFIV